MLARGSFPWVLASIAIALIATWFSLFLVEVIAFLFFFFFLIFFRDPERHPEGEGLLSPADGVILDVADERVTIFMNLHNVHVNRAPLDGAVKAVHYIKGSFLPAFKKGAESNERNIIKLETSDGEIEVVQIAGILARRIHCYVKAGDKLQRGQRIGMISFGSRVDVSIPRNYSITVKSGVKVKAGQTVIAIKRGM